MPKTQKQKLMGLLLLTSLLMFLISISLSALRMKPGEIILPHTPDQPRLGEAQLPIEINWFFVVLQGLIVVLLILMFVHILLSLFDKEARRDLLSRLLKFGLSIVLIFSLSKITFPAAEPGEPILLQPGYAAPPEFAVDVVNPPGFEPTPQPWLLPLFMMGAAILMALITFGVVRFLSRRKTTDQPQFQALANNVQNALEEIEEAEIDFNDVIVRCYAEMSQTLKAENDIQRVQTMTTHEFEQELLHQGFPAQPVQQLTKLFEQVRYGRRKPAEDEKRAAIESLNEIAVFCKGQV